MIHVLLTSALPWQRSDIIAFFTCLCISRYQGFFFFFKNRLMDLVPPLVASVSRTLKTGKVIKSGFKCHEFSSDFLFTSERPHYSQLFSSFSIPPHWSWLVGNLIQPIRSTSQIWVVTRHLSMEFLGSFLRRHFAGKPVVTTGVAKSRLFSPARRSSVLNIL